MHKLGTAAAVQQATADAQERWDGLESLGPRAMRNTLGRTPARGYKTNHHGPPSGLRTTGARADAFVYRAGGPGGLGG